MEKDKHLSLWIWFLLTWLFSVQHISLQMTWLYFSCMGNIALGIIHLFLIKWGVTTLNPQHAVGNSSVISASIGVFAVGFLQIGAQECYIYIMFTLFLVFLGNCSPIFMVLEPSYIPDSSTYSSTLNFLNLVLFYNNVYGGVAMHVWV